MYFLKTIERFDGGMDTPWEVFSLHRNRWRFLFLSSPSPVCVTGDKQMGGRWPWTWRCSFDTVTDGQGMSVNQGLGWWFKKTAVSSLFYPLVPWMEGRLAAGWTGIAQNLPFSRLMNREPNFTLGISQCRGRKHLG